jgi:hypothetical protein
MHTIPEKNKKITTASQKRNCMFYVLLEYNKRRMKTNLLADKLSTYILDN